MWGAPAILKVAVQALPDTDLRHACGQAFPAGTLPDVTCRNRSAARQGKFVTFRGLCRFDFQQQTLQPISRSAEGSATPYAIGIPSSPCGSARGGTRLPD